MMDLEQMIKTFGMSEDDVIEAVEHFNAYRMDTLPRGLSKEDLPVSSSSFGALLDDMGFSLTEAELVTLIGEVSMKNILEGCTCIKPSRPHTLTQRKTVPGTIKQHWIQAKLDPDGKGYIVLSNFLRNGAKTLFDSTRITEETAREVFNLIDHDRDSMVTINDLKRMMKMFGEEYPNYYIREMLKEVDIDGDDMISFDEFLLFTTGIVG